MENFFYGGDFYMELSDLMDDLGIEEDEINDLPDDYTLECKEARLEPIVTLSQQWICERINDERWPDDNDTIQERVAKVLNENIHFEKINSLMPKLYYESRKKFLITKQDLVEYIS